MEKIITGCFTGFFALFFAVYVSFTLRGKGPIWSNSYIWLTKEQKDKFDKKAGYKLVSIIFGSLSLCFLCLSINIFTQLSLFKFGFWALIIFTIIYALYDCVKQSKK